MSIISVISGKFLAAAERRGRRMARQQLLRMSDRQLEDFGISRYSLMEGISAWPWQEVPTGELAGEGLVRVPAITNVPKDALSTKEIKKAVNDLSAYSDRELAELGVPRQSIEELVRNGRPTIEGAGVKHNHVA